MKLSRSIRTSILVVAIGLIGCEPNRPTFDENIAFVEDHRDDLATLVSDIQNQSSLRRLIRSNGREYVTVIYRDGRIVEGYIDDWKWDNEILVWIKRLQAAECHGFDDNPEWLTSLYLDQSTYIAVPREVPVDEEYTAWAKAGENREGYRCFDLGDGWYLDVQAN
ncbi:hypothetical protein [Puniceicoccus vermicola]|uniref:Uncharacterized protein n=1 Tax=Puniceicoccus vermicola TaxID=388746 RepID=A0A7X1AWM9_9BACT|nr:hypothetical protein [Puniceicoccus vermicola]MBC2601259.1 hypothetical protein [Puniceicoccus vermicola]